MNGGFTSRRVDRQLAFAATKALPQRVSKEDLAVFRSVPVMIHTNGLTATCAYLLAQAKRETDHPHHRAARALLEDALGFAESTPNPKPGTALELLDRLNTLDDQHYVIAEGRARLFAVWLARLAAARHQAQPPTVAAPAGSQR